jgi:TfoX/Sxy family transcriptional regulator of competence genes
MAYDEELAERIRALAKSRRGLTEKRMFGGLAILDKGKMACGVLGKELVVRVGPDRHGDALSKPHVRPMDFTGRAMKGFVYVSAEGLVSKKELTFWFEAGLAGAASGKPSKAKSKSKQ